MDDSPQELIFDDEVEPSGRSSPALPVVQRLHPIRWLSAVGVILYLIAPWFTALNLMTENGNPSFSPGWFLLFFGEFGLFAVLDGDVSAVGWSANPLFALGMLGLVFGKRDIAFGLMTAAAIFSLTSFWLKEITIDEGGHMAKVVGYDLGFWIWMGAIWFNFVVILLVWLLPQKQGRSNPAADE